MSSQPNISNSPLDFEPLHIILPLLTHTNTIIALHGRGSQGPEFADELFESKTSSSLTLQQHFLHCKWVFPSSQERFSTVFHEELNEWFDIYSLTDPSSREDLQIKGLRDSLNFLQQIIEKEATFVGSASRVVLLGLSQGCETALMTMLAGNLRLGAFVGLNGWMPFREKLEACVEGGTVEDMSERLSQFYMQNLILKTSALRGKRCHMLKTPVFLGHTADDEAVDITLGQEAKKVLKMMGMKICWEECEIGGHLGFLRTEGLDRINCNNVSSHDHITRAHVYADFYNPTDSRDPRHWAILIKNIDRTSIQQIRDDVGDVGYHVADIIWISHLATPARLFRKKVLVSILDSSDVEKVGSLIQSDQWIIKAKRGIAKVG
ncbi:hypothetical protein ACLMJK_000233 [Lecanora helva]